jgi:N-acetyl-alpha-D-muramate 1-phosphate uridylyltransferase
MQAVVLAGGLATRLGERALDTPKFLLPVAGRPFAHWLLARLRDDGYDDVVVCIGHLGGAIRAQLGDGAALGVRLVYSDEGDRRLGTAGALRWAAAALEPTFLATYGDSYLPFDYAAPLRDLEAHAEAFATLAVYRNHDELDRSNVRVDGERVVEYRKPRPGEAATPPLEDIDYGAMAIRRSAILPLELGAARPLERLQTDWARQGVLRALRARSPFFEIGSAEGLARLEHDLAAGLAPSPRSLPPLPSLQSCPRTQTRARKQPP